MPVLDLFAIFACVIDARRILTLPNEIESWNLGSSQWQDGDSRSLKALSSLLFAPSPIPFYLALDSPHSGLHTTICDGRCLDGKRSLTLPPMMQFQNPFDGLKNPIKNKRDGSTTVVLSIGFFVSDRGPSSLLGKLDDLADSADTSSAEGLAELCGETALLLLRRDAEWISTHGSATHKGDEEDSLRAYERLTIKGAAKFEERDISLSTDAAAVNKKAELSAQGASTLAVVTIVACVAGDVEKELQAPYEGGAAAMKESLQELAASANDADNVLAFELFWVPGDDEEVIDNEDIIVDWPELIPC